MKTIEYIQGIERILENIPLEEIDGVIAVLQAARAEGNRIFIMGNGGSGSTASHITADLMKGCSGWGQSFVMCLNDNMATLTAWANDDEYPGVFLQQIRTLAAKDDVVMILSGSGESDNILAAVFEAKRRGCIIVALTGQVAESNGGTAAIRADLSVVVPSDNMQMIEDVHLMIGHMIATAMREPFMTENRRPPLPPPGPDEIIDKSAGLPGAPS